MSNSLLLSRRFAPLFWCQFFAAFNDNFLKNALILLILFKIGGAPGESLVTLAGAIFIAPYFILSALGGQIADKFDKALIAQRLKLAEIAAAGVAVLGFQLASVPVLLGALFFSAPSERCSARPNTAYCPITCVRKIFPVAMRSSKARPSSPYSPAP